MPTTANIWNLLVSSGLVSSANVAEIRTHCEEDLGSGKSDMADAILKWLRDQKRISGYQMQVLAEGQAGPFRFEQYRVHARIAGGPLDGFFRARHIATNHPVRLHFFGGDQPEDARAWGRIRRFTMPLTKVTSPFVSRCYEIVEDGEYRFVVFEDLPGRPLADKLPYKARLPWPQTMQAIELLAIGLAEIHGNGCAHGRLWPGSIWLQRGGICQMLWEIPGLNFDPDQPTEMARIPNYFQPPRARGRSKQLADVATRQRNDLFSLGGLAFRMIAGKPPRIKGVNAEERKSAIKKHLEYCHRYELPENVAQLMQLLMTADISNELKDAEVTARLAGTILESQSIKADVERPLPTLQAFDAAMSQKNRSKGFLDTLESIDGVPAASPDTDTTGPPASPFANLDAADSKLSARERLAKRHNKKKSLLPLMLGGSILVTAVILGVVLGGVLSSKDDQSAANSDSSTATDADRTDEDDKVAKNGAGEDTPAEVKPVAFRPQNVINDNDNIPWESPTGAEPIDVQLMPAAPDFLFSLRPRRLYENEQSRHFVQSLGPSLQSLSDEWSQKTGVAMQVVERLNISLHTNETGRFATVVVAELAEPLAQDGLWERMGKPTVEDDVDSGFRKFVLDDRLVYFEPNKSETVSTFGFGPAELLNESMESLGPRMAGREMSELIKRSDRDRDVTVIFRNAALLSEEGRWLFSGDMTALRRPLSLFLDDRMEAIKLSLHFDNGSYLEWMSVQTAEMSDDDLVEWLLQNLADLRDQLSAYVSQIPPHPYWSKVQQRFDNMVIELVRQVRVGKEREGVVANCWLPEAAPHNLVTAGELVMNGPAFEGSVVLELTGPKTLQELLDSPRDLTVNSDPDLINLLRDIELEVRDDFPQLPFDFRIRLLGNDLAEEGITQNQRPGKVDVSQKPLGEILAQIMLQANPDKSATSPADETCKLIWVIGPDPEDPATQAVLVTTRKAATARNLTLPPMFQPE